tara:strand:- start:690 stop:920 length:231 start_codon:yes stop_codon:yes gene_type:complete
MSIADRVGYGVGTVMYYTLYYPYVEVVEDFSGVGSFKDATIERIGLGDHYENFMNWVYDRDFFVGYFKAIDKNLDK